MSRVIVDGPDLVVGLSWLEKLGAAGGEVRHLRCAGLARARPTLDFVRLTGGGMTSLKTGPDRLGWGPA